MKRLLAIVCVGLICFVSISSYAQVEQQNIKEHPSQEVPKGDLKKAEHPQPGENILQLKMDYVKKNFTLNDEKSIKFWPLYERYLQAERDIHETSKQQLEKIGIERKHGRIDFSQIEDEKIYLYYEHRFKQHESLANNERNFYQEMKKMLSAQEIVEFYRIEREFKRQLFKGAQEKRALERTKMEKLDAKNVEELQK